MFPSQIEPVPDLSDPSERERLSPAAVRGFFNIVDLWRINDDDARRLLGESSKVAYRDLQRNRGRDCALDEDKLRRVSYLVGIFDALNNLYGKELADSWMQLPNKNRIFGGMTPHEYLMQGGLPEFATVRMLLDARQAGH